MKCKIFAFLLTLVMVFTSATFVYAVDDHIGEEHCPICEALGRSQCYRTASVIKYQYAYYNASGNYMYSTLEPEFDSTVFYNGQNNGEPDTHYHNGYINKINTTVTIQEQVPTYSHYYDEDGNIVYYISGYIRTITHYTTYGGYLSCTAILK